MRGVQLVSSFCDVCSAVSRSISWAQCLQMFEIDVLVLGIYVITVSVALVDKGLHSLVKRNKLRAPHKGETNDDDYDHDQGAIIF